jgi:hypothetical protein
MNYGTGVTCTDINFIPNFVQVNAVIAMLNWGQAITHTAGYYYKPVSSKEGK